MSFGIRRRKERDGMTKAPGSAADAPDGRLSRTAQPLLVATSAPRKARGLLFAREHAEALLLAPCCDVHTVGMRHRLDIAFVDAQGLVLEAHRDVGPFRRLRNNGAAAVVERFSSCASPWFSTGDRVGVVCLKGERK